jgi:hypothetical protein
MASLARQRRFVAIDETAERRARAAANFPQPATFLPSH